MSTVPFYQVDAFGAAPFTGNPAAVCLLDRWRDDALLAAIAAENNLSETAYLVFEQAGYRIRWFTPAAEVDLCGHATLAAAHVVFTALGPGEPQLTFASRSGPLHVAELGAPAAGGPTRPGRPAAAGAQRGGDETDPAGRLSGGACGATGRYRLDFPRLQPEPCATPAGLLEALGLACGPAPLAVLTGGGDLLVRLTDAAAVDAVAPDFAALAKVRARGVIVTAPGETTDFCSRFFGPAVGVPEDPVTGSAHCALGPYWAEVLGRTALTAEQRSARGGRLAVGVGPDRVTLEGQCVTVITGELHLP